MSGRVSGAGALFLDRDGVINIDRGYVSRPQDVEFIDGIFQVVRGAIDRGLLPVVVTNQAGIARGFYTESDFEALTLWMRQRFEAEGSPLAAVYHCPYHSDGIGQWRVDDHPDRKPNPGMLLRAIRDFDLDPAASLLVGDQESDILAGRRAALRGVARFSREGAVETAADALLADHAQTLAWIRQMSPALTVGG